MCDPGLGGAEVPGVVDFGVDGDEPAGSAAEGRLPEAPIGWPCDLKLSNATRPSTVPVIESSTRFIGGQS